MNARYTIGNSSQHPIVQALTFVVAAAVLILALVMGFVVLAVLLGAGVVLGLVLWLRMWWLSRKLRAEGFTPTRGLGRTGTRSQHGRVIDVEYSVVRDEDSNEPEER